MAGTVEQVLVTGASGYIASHIVRQLLQAGYRVRGTVRSLQNETKVKPLQELCPDAKYPLELVEADLLKTNGWADAVQGCSHVLHTASPFPNNNPTDANELIKPAVEGTLAVLKACQESGGVRRVVLTSSVAAVSGGIDHRTEHAPFTEEDWPNLNKTSINYTKSKTLAEKAAWEFVKDMSENERFELTTINPSIVFGPVLCGGYATSIEIPKRLLEHGLPGLPYLNFAIVDVRDVAKAHVVAMTLPEAAGKRHIVAPHTAWFYDIAKIYKEEFGPFGYNVPTWQVPYFLIKALSWFNTPTRLSLPGWGIVARYDSTRMTSVLGITPKPLRETLVDMGHSLILRGFVKATPLYKDRNETR